MKNPVIIPALADLRQDIAGAIPVDLIRSWVESDRSPAAHERLLAPFARKGTVVKSDSAGLSKLTVSRPLIEVLKLVNEPKEIIAAHGIGIGGEPIGTWIADDTEMFYPESVAHEDVLDAMIAVQHANRTSTVQVGLAIHQGTFLHIGNGLYGTDAELVEDVAENHTRAGEILIASTKQAVDFEAVQPRAKPAAQYSYPAPFSKDFLRELRELTSERYEEVSGVYSHDAVIVLIRVFHDHQPLLLDTMSGFVSANSDVMRIAGKHDVQKIKSNGQLAIFRAKSADDGVQFATAVRDELVQEAWSSNIAVTMGSVFLFPLESGDTEIAGGPVNVASKLAEDTEERDAIFVEESVASSIKHSAEPFSVMRSGVQLSGVKL